MGRCAIPVFYSEAADRVALLLRRRMSYNGQTGRPDIDLMIFHLLTTLAAVCRRATSSTASCRRS